MKRTFSSLMVAGGMLAAGHAMADDNSWLQWQSNSLTYLYGQDFKVDPQNQQTITFEHADSWKYGDTFLFVDNTRYNGKGSSSNGHYGLYGEFSPRFSLGKIFNEKFEFGPIKDVLVATTYEFGKGDVNTFLIGPGFDLNIPGFDYFQLNFYDRIPDSSRAGNNVWQITPVWSYTIPVGRSDILIDGYMDWVVSGTHNKEGDYHANLHFNPQVKYDLGKFLHWTPQKVYVGFEYDYWTNKYGIATSHDFDTNQNTASLLLKVFF